MKKPFFPKDKPKSWVVAVSAVLCGLLVGAPLTVLGIVAELSALEVLGRVVFVCSWAIGFASGLFFNIRLWTGRYRGLDEREWHEQVW